MSITTAESIEDNEKRFVSSETGIVSAKGWTETEITGGETELITISQTEEQPTVGWSTSLWNYVTSFYA